MFRSLIIFSVLGLSQVAPAQEIIEMITPASGLTRTLGVDCQNGYRVEFESQYSGEGRNMRMRRLNSIKVIKLLRDGSGIHTYTVSNSMDPLPDSVPTTPIKVQFNDSDDKTVVDLSITMDVKTCPHGKYSSSFPATCRGTVEVGSRRTNFDEREAEGYVSWEYTTEIGREKTIKSAGASAKTVREVLSQTKNLTNFDNVNSKSCD